MREWERGRDSEKKTSRESDREKERARESKKENERERERSRERERVRERKREKEREMKLDINHQGIKDRAGLARDRHTKEKIGTNTKSSTCMKVFNAGGSLEMLLVLSFHVQ